MKKVVLVLFIMVSFCCLSLFIEGQKETESPVIKEIPEFWYACMEFKGPYSNMAKEINRFFTEFSKQKLRPTGPSICTYYNSPFEVSPEELKWAFGITVAKGTAVKKPIKLVQFKPKKAVFFLHTGPYNQLPQAVKHAVTFAERNGYEYVWPLYDRYLNSPAKVKPEDLKTEIIIPVKKK